MGKFWLIATMIVCILGLGGTAWAFPGTSSALNGVEDVFTGYLPPPGFHLLNYMLYYDGQSIRDEKGDKIPGAKATLVADAVRILYVSKLQGPFGSSVAWHVVLPMVHKDITVPTVGLDRNFSGMGDMYLSPIILGWNLPEDFHMAAGLDVILPTGEYDKDDLIGNTMNPGIGSNHYTFEPVIAFTKIFGEMGVILDTKLMYDIHTEEEDTGITTGNQFHTDFAATMPVDPKVPLRVGVNGYYFMSVTQDQRHEVDLDPNSKEHVFAIGPIARYDFAQTTSLSLKVQFEQDAHNRPQGDAVWLKFVHSF